eukprot:7638283-Alexandrium_andersonii.AAC.1
MGPLQAISSAFRPQDSARKIRKALGSAEHYIEAASGRLPVAVSIAVQRCLTPVGASQHLYFVGLK